MNQPITMPVLSDTMTHGRLVRWVKKVGDHVDRGECVAEVETDKAVMEIEAHAEGFLAGPLMAADTEWPVGSVIGFISDTVPAEDHGRPQAAIAGPLASPAGALADGTGTAAHPNSTLGMEVRFVEKPAALARRYLRARESHKSSAPAAVPSNTEPPTPASVPANRTPIDLSAPPRWPSAVRALMARTAVKCAATPTFRAEARIPMGALLQFALRADFSVTLLLARALARCAATHPLFNALCSSGGIRYRQQTNVGIVVQVPDGTVAPVMRDVAARPWRNVEEDWRTVQTQARTRSLNLSQYQGATLYLFDLHESEVIERFDALLPSGATLLLCVGALRREEAFVTLVCDHRAVSPVDAGAFLISLQQLLAAPDAVVTDFKQP